MISGDSTKMCSCISVTPRPSASIGPRTVLTCAISPPPVAPVRHSLRCDGAPALRPDESNIRWRARQVGKEEILKAANRLSAFLFYGEDPGADGDAPFARDPGGVRRDREIDGAVADTRTARGDRNPTGIRRGLPGAALFAKHIQAAAAAANRNRLARRGDEVITVR